MPPSASRGAISGGAGLIGGDDEAGLTAVALARPPTLGLGSGRLLGDRDAGDELGQLGVTLGEHSGVGVGAASQLVQLGLTGIELGPSGLHGCERVLEIGAALLDFGDGRQQAITIDVGEADVGEWFAVEVDDCPDGLRDAGMGVGRVAHRLGRT